MQVEAEAIGRNGFKEGKSTRAAFLLHLDEVSRIGPEATVQVDRRGNRYNAAPLVRRQGRKGAATCQA